MKQVCYVNGLRIDQFTLATTVILAHVHGNLYRSCCIEIQCMGACPEHYSDKKKLMILVHNIYFVRITTIYTETMIQKYRTNVKKCCQHLSHT